MKAINELEVRKWYEVFKDNKKLVEIRIFDGKFSTYSGYFTSIEPLLKAIRPFHDKTICYTINEINESCYSRSQGDRILKNPKASTKDVDITFREWFFIDIDPVHDTDNNASDDEKEEAHKVMKNVRSFLRDMGFSEPILVDSANGYHLFYKIELANNDENKELIKTVLAELSILFSTEKATIDLAIFNAARVVKIAGTYSSKGRSTETRPQRMAKILNIPMNVLVTDKGYLKKVADLMPKPEKPVLKNNFTKASDFDLEDFLSRNGISVARTIRGSFGVKYVLEECPFDSNHKSPDSAIFRLTNGAIGFKCFHNSCANRTWQDVRLMFEPDAYTRKEQADNSRRYKPYINKNIPITSTPQKVVQKKGEVWQRMSEIEDVDRSKIISIHSGVKAYDNRCCGFDIPSVSVWSGNNGAGKSKLLNQISINAANEGFRVGIYSGELSGARLKNWLLFQAAGKGYNKKSMYNELSYYTPPSIKKRITEWMDNKILIYNTLYSNELTSIVLEVEKIMKTYPLDMLVLDNLSALSIDNLGGIELVQQKKAIAKIVSLSQEENIAVHLVVHPRKSAEFLRKDDISGAKTITDLADNVFFVHRWEIDTEKAAQRFLPPLALGRIMTEGATNIVEVIKHREFGMAVHDIYNLYFEQESERMKNDPYENIVYGWADIEPNEQVECPF